MEARRNDLSNLEELRWQDAMLTRTPSEGLLSFESIVVDKDSFVLHKYTIIGLILAAAHALRKHTRKRGPKCFTSCNDEQEGALPALWFLRHTTIFDMEYTGLESRGLCGIASEMHPGMQAHSFGRCT